MEEERRLFYVAATRAMRDLTLSASLERRRTNRFFGGGLSRFLREVPAEKLLVESRHGATVNELIELAQRWGGAAPPWSPGRGSWPPRPVVSDAPADVEFVRESSFRGQGSAGSAARTDPGNAGEDLPTIQRPKKSASLKGRRVRHNVFGVGKVEDEEGSGPQARLTISFPGVGRKRILARFVQPV